MKIELLISKLNKLGISFYTGVPDSQLKALCAFLWNEYGIDACHHVVAANEGAATALAAGHFLATGNPAAVYMQNSGIGNAINPICSLLNRKVYAIPVLFIIGWRGEPNIKDEPQHVFQGEITLQQLSLLSINYSIIDPNTDGIAFEDIMQQCSNALNAGNCYALVVRKGALEYSNGICFENKSLLTREKTIQIVLEEAQSNSAFISTTGKLSRELFELRVARGEDHSCDFLTVGSMGHSLMIACGIATQKPERPVFCLDGDGAMIMHMGSLAVAGSLKCNNLTHIVIDNGAHETVGGIPTVSYGMDTCSIAQACGYATVFKAETEQELRQVMKKRKLCKGASFILVKTNMLSRSDLGRPTTTPIENRDAFMSNLEDA